MSRMTTSCASFSWARLAMRRACSRDVSVASAPFGLRPKCSPVLAISVEPEGLDQLGHGRRYDPVDRLASADAVTDLARRDRHRLDLEQLDAIRPRQLLQDRVQSLARKARSRCDSDPREREHAFGILPGEEVH